MATLMRTIFFDRHIQLGAKMVDFGGWEMPVQYPSGIIEEHLNTRKHAGIFDVSHMGRFTVGGKDALAFLQYALTNNAAALETEESQYTMIANDSGGAIDDAYLYRFEEDAYLLVVNAANREVDWAHLQTLCEKFDAVELEDKTPEIAMISLQGPASRKIVEDLIESGRLPEPKRNALSTVNIAGAKIRLARTGYTGEPVCFELFIATEHALALWDNIINAGAHPVGLGARDTLRLEAGLPLYGHELGTDPEGGEIPIFACPLAKFAVSFSPLKGEFIGKAALEKQFAAYEKILERDYSLIGDLPRRIMPVELIDRGIARAGAFVFKGEESAGFITSGTMVPYWVEKGHGVLSELSDKKDKRAIALAYADSRLNEGDEVEIDIRGKRISALVVPYHLRSEAPPYARAITCHQTQPTELLDGRTGEYLNKAVNLLNKAQENHFWRRNQCINLIPSEQISSLASRLLSITDPAGRYAEHKPVKAFCEAEVFYYQGTDFIARVEELLVEEFQEYLGCSRVETRPVSGQMANTAVFSAIVDFVNRADRKAEQRRIRRILNNHIIKGGHLSAQPLGALRDFVARDPVTEKPAVVNFPVMEDNPYRIDVDQCAEIIDRYRPELIIFGKSMVLHKEPVTAIRKMVDEMNLSCFVMYDMAHVLGLIGPYFQLPFQEGADIVTGSTHKTFFGTQRGIVATDYAEDDLRFEFWEAIQRRAFPGSTSNHHLGTLLGLLFSAYEMNAFKTDYQQAVIANAKTFARALSDCGLNVAGDPAMDFTETHQVILNVGYGTGPAVARRLEENNIIVNYQAAPDEEGFTASGALRMGVQEMTRFGMTGDDFKQLAQMIADVISGTRNATDDVIKFRGRFLEMQYCFSEKELGDQLQRMAELL